MFRLLFACIFLSLLFYGLSQPKDNRYEQTISLYRKGDAYYAKALHLSTAKNYKEAREDSLNRLALDCFQQFLRSATEQPLPSDSLFFWASLKAGELEHLFDSLPQALRYYNSALSLKQKKPLVTDTAFFKPYVLAGVIYYQQNNFDSALAYLKKADSIQDKILSPLEESGRLYNVLGSICFEYGNYRQAKNYFQKAGEVQQRLNPGDQRFFVNYKMNLAASLFKLEEYNLADSLYRSLLPKGGFFLNHIYHNLGQIQSLLGAPQKALGYLQKVRYSNGASIGLNNDIASAYFGLGEFDSTKKYLAVAREQSKIYLTAGVSIDYGRTLKISGDLEKGKDQFTEALRYYQQALHQFYPSFTDTSSAANPGRFSGAFSYINLFQTLAAKAETMEALYHQGRKEDRAAQALETYKAAFSLLDYVEQTYESDEARLFLTRIKYALHNKPIDLAFERYQQTGDKKYLSLLYVFDQQNKAAVLVLNRQLNTALAGNTLPAVRKERSIKDEITRLSIKATQITDSLQLANLSNSIRDYEIELGKLQENLSAETVVEGNSIPSLDFLQTSLLDAKTALVSYHLSADKLTTLIVTANDIRCRQQPLPKNFTNLIQQEILLLKTPPVKPAAQNRGLYNLLLANVPLVEMNQLIIVPDDVLAYLPFESLQNEKGKFLIQDAAVQYQFSTALLTKNETDFSDAETLSFAPFATQSYTDSLSVLPASAKEIAGTKGRRFFDTAATKEAFLAYCNSLPIVHLATHAVVNNSADNFSCIAFARSQKGKDNLLYAQEIYNLRLERPGLVILSACETGAGSLVKGEGVLSLSRAFAYAGCPNVITSLWKADDFSTAYLTTHIHRYLSEGCSIAKATQQAKIAYLNDKTINPRLKHPYYWSHLVFVGAYSPQKTFSWGWTGAAVVVVLLLLFIYKIKSRRAGQ